MNYSHSIKEYVNLLRSIIDKTENTKFILSDECIFDHNNYFGYLNVYLLSEILNLLSNYYETKIKFIISIRNQYEILISSYAYDYYRKKNILFHLIIF